MDQAKLQSLKRKFGAIKNEVSNLAGKRQRSRTRVRRVSNSALLQEVKYSDVYVSNSSVTQTASIYSLNITAQGDNYNQRNGNQILMKYLQYNWTCQQYAGTARGYQYTVYIVLDRQPNASAPVASDILDTTILPVFVAMKALFKNQERFKILKTHKLVVGQPGNDDGVVNDFIDFTKMEPRDRVVRYQSGTGLDPQTNGLYALLVTENNTPLNVGFYGGFRFAFNEA